MGRPTQQTEMMRTRGFISTEEAARAMGYRGSSMTRLAKTKKVESETLGRFHYLKLEALIAYLGESSRPMLDPESAGAVYRARHGKAAKKK